MIFDEEKLGARSNEVDVIKQGTETRQAVLDLKKAIRENKYVGLSAVQLGIEWDFGNKKSEDAKDHLMLPPRILCIDFNGDIRTFINPVIAEMNGVSLSREKCYCLPGKEFLTVRNSEIVIYYQTPLGKTESRKLVGKAAYIMQHLINHLDGVLVSNIGCEIDEQFDKATQEERDEFINAFIESLDLKGKSLHKEIEENSELKKMNDAITFIQKVQKGEVKIEPHKNETVRN